MSLRAFGTSRVGRRHEERGLANEDRFLVADLTKVLRILHSNLDPSPLGHLQDLRGHVLAVADGVSRSAGGAESSELASEVLSGYLLHTVPWFVRLEPGSDRNFGEDLRQAFEACHAALRGRRKSDSDKADLATTLTLAYVAWRKLYVAHVGDSRCYLYRDGTLTATTRDHTMAQDLIDDNSMTEEDARQSPLAHVLTSAIGASGPPLRVQVLRANLRAGDRLLLTSDGVHGSLDDERLESLLGRHENDKEACETIVRAAVDGGSTDDATCVCATFYEDDDAPTTDS